MSSSPVSPSPHGLGRSGGSVASSLAPEYAALRDLVAQAARGEINFEKSMPAGDRQADEATDPPLKFPSGWYVTAQPQGRRNLRPELRAALLGLAAGIAVLLPVSLWLHASDASRALVPTADLAATAGQLVADARGASMSGLALNDIAQSLQAASLETATLQETDLDEARRLVSEGDVNSARSVLATAAAANNPRALFLMAETFDPNMLAAWGTRGVAANPDLARQLYAAANALGHDKVDARLDALK